MSTPVALEHKKSIVDQIEALKKSGWSTIAAAKKVGVHWGSYYGYRKDLGTPKQESKAKAVTEEMIREAIEKSKEGITYRISAQKFGVSVSTLGSAIYRHRREQNGNSVEPAREIVRMSASKDNESKMLKIENQRLKMLVAEYALDIMQLKEYGARG